MLDAGMGGQPEPDFAVQLREDLSMADMRHVLTVFAGDLERLSGMIASASAAGEVVVARRSAHALAGAAGAVGASRLDAACRAIATDAEIDAPEGGRSALARHGAAIVAASRMAALALARVTRTLDGPGAGAR